MEFASELLLEQLVNIDSGTGDREGLEAIAAILYSQSIQLQTEFQTVVANDGSTHYMLKRGQGKRIVLIAHLDTVFPKGTAAKRPFTVKKGIAYGPGVSDCKSGVVTILGALHLLAQKSWPQAEIVCLFNTDEEISSPGSRKIIEMVAKKARAVLVAEPSEGDNITVSRKAIGRFELQVTGKAAHAGSNHSDGRNAILELAHKIIAIENLTGMDTGVTLNVGSIQGGSRPNIVPDSARAEIDLRFIQPGQDKLVMAKLQEITNHCKVVGTSGSLKGGVTRPPMPKTPENMKLYELIREAGTELKLNLGITESGGGSDANFTAALGVPTLDGLGPIGGGHHAEDEYLQLSSLPQRIALLAKVIPRIIG